jgi:c-di-GMP-binding flagellar brake protein YcgR
MLTGIINRRIANRASFEADFMIKFVNPDGAVLVLATAMNISAGGMRFSILKNTLLLNIGDKIEFIFQLPDSGNIPVSSEIRYRDIRDDDPEVHYGVKFLNISLDNWNNIINYCRSNPSDSNANPFGPVADRAPQQLSASDDSKITASIILEEDGTTFSGKIEDISFGGARINTRHFIPVNCPVSLNIEDRNTSVAVKGYCIWSAPERSDVQVYLAGIFFPHLDEEQFDKLRTLINASSGKTG